MDIQLKKGVLDSCVLAALCGGDSYGYQIIKDVSECVSVSESTLYPILKRLESQECVNVYSVEHNSRLRRYYSITEAGRQRILEFLSEWDEITAIIHFIRRLSGSTSGGLNYEQE